MSEFTKYLDTLEAEQESKDSAKELYNGLYWFQKSGIDNLTQNIKTYDLEKLMFLIQPIWNKIHQPNNNVSNKQQLELLIGLHEYKSRGFDMEYLTNGAGAPNNCAIL